MTPQSQLGSSQPQGQPSPQGSQAQQGESDVGGVSLFGSQEQQQAATQSAAKQLISEVASIHSSMKGLAKAHPEMSESIDKAMQLLTSGMTKAISTMQPKKSEGKQPAYA